MNLRAKYRVPIGKKVIHSGQEIKVREILGNGYFYAEGYQGLLHDSNFTPILFKKSLPGRYRIYNDEINHLD